MKQLSSDVNCKLFSASARVDRNQPLPGEKIDFDNYFLAEKEHGPYANGFLALADVHLLSYSDKFIGSSAGGKSYISSFSMLIASLIRVRRHGWVSPIDSIQQLSNDNNDKTDNIPNKHFLPNFVDIGLFGERLDADDSPFRRYVLGEPLFCNDFHDYGKYPLLHTMCPWFLEPS